MASTAFQIPLDVKYPHIDTPAESAQQAASVQAMLQEKNLRQQQIQQNQMKLQEQALQQASQRALSQAIQSNMKPDPSGTVAVDYDGVYRSLGQMGYGKDIPGLQADAIKIGQEQAKLYGDKLKNQAESAEQIAQSLQNVKDDPSYQAILPHLDAIFNGMRQQGVQVPPPPRQFDSTWIAGTAATGTKIADGLRKMQLAATAAQEAPKTAEEWRLLGDKTMSEASPNGQDWLDRISVLKSRGMPSDMLDLYGNSFSPQKVAQLRENLIPPAEREKIFQQKITDAGNRIQAQGTSLAGYTRAYDAIDDPKVKAQFRNPEELHSAEDLNRAVDEAFGISTTPAQKIQEREAKARIAETGALHEETRRHNREMEGLTQEARDIQQQRADQTAANKGGTAGGRQLTPGQVKVEERNIANLEYGTANRPGLHSQRVALGQQIKKGVDAKGQPLEEGGRQAAEERLQSLTDTLQNTQFRKADLYNIGKPNPDDVKAAKDGDEMEADDGSTWRKRDGVAYFVKRGTGEAAPAAAAPAPRAQAPAAPPAQKPHTTAPPAQPGAPKVGQRFKNAAGVIIHWDGTQMIDDKTGKPYQQ